MKTKHSHLFSVLTATLGLAAALVMPEMSIAQSSTTISLDHTGYVYQGGRRSSRGLKRTTSCVTLPNLNAILSPAPLPKKTPVKITQTKQQATTTTQSPVQKPRFGYGSGPVTPPTVNGQTSVNPATQPHPQQQIVQTQPQTTIIQHTTTIPFAHSYYPRTYVPSIPFVYPSYGCRSHYYGYGIYNSRAPLRGSLTSSRNYLSGFRSFGFSF